MANVSVTNNFSNGTTADAEQVDTNFTDLVNFINNRNTATAAWDAVKSESSSNVPLVCNNSSGTQNIVQFQDNGSNVFIIADGGAITITGTTLTYNNTLSILAGTADSSDSNRIIICGGGANGATRGGAIILHGNEFSTSSLYGDVAITLGNGDGGSNLGDFTIANSSTTVFKVANDGDITTTASDWIYSNSLLFRASTSDGSDNIRLQLAGGGALDSTRGAYITVNGNEFSTGNAHGDVVIQLGAGDGGSNKGDMIVSGAAVGLTVFNTGGLNIGAPTSGDKGAGTLNTAGDIYKNNTAYTNPDYVLEHWVTGKIEKFKNNDGAVSYPGLKPLEDLELYMKENLDLPGVKERFRDESGAQGIFSRADIALEKIEELAIYVTQLHKRMKSLEKA